jgi:hypothetical protein
VDSFNGAGGFEPKNGGDSPQVSDNMASDHRPHSTGKANMKLRLRVAPDMWDIINDVEGGIRSSFSSLEPMEEGKNKKKRNPAQAYQVLDLIFACSDPIPSVS